MTETARVPAAQRPSGTSDRLPVAVALFDTDAQLLTCTPAWVEFCTRHAQVPAASVAPGARFDHLMPCHENAPAVTRVLTGEVVQQPGLRVATDDRAPRWDVTLAPTAVGGAIVGFVATATEATDRHRDYERLVQRIAAFAAIADAMTLEHPLERTLRHIAHSVRSATQAEAAAVVVWEDEELRNLSAYGDDGLPTGYRAAVEEAYALGVDSPIRNVTMATGVTVIRGFRARAEQDPCYRPLHPMWAAMSFDDTVVVPLGSRGRCVGCLLLYVTAGREVDEDERAFLHAIADQSAVAVENSRLFGQAESHATVVERQRLARELHDSVSQALFSMTLHARSAERQLGAHDVPDDDPLAVSLAALSELTRGALAEMRALIFELRPGALEQDGLLAALTRQAQAMKAREGLAITVSGPVERLPVDARAEEHLYRLVLEALNNTVKHASATSAQVDVTVDHIRRLLTVVVRDDGCGFDPATVPVGHLGQVTMRDRAAAVDGDLTVDSSVGGGCTVTVRVPIGSIAVE